MEIDGRGPSLTWAYSKFPQPLRGSPCFFVSPVNENHNDTVSHKGALGIPGGAGGFYGALPPGIKNPPARTLPTFVQETKVGARPA